MNVQEDEDPIQKKRKSTKSKKKKKSNNLKVGDESPLMPWQIK